jgi:hypothetical protein
MQQSQHDDAMLLDTVERSIGKSRNNRAAHLTVHGGEHIRMTLHGVKRRACSGEETLAKTGLLCFVILERSGEIAPTWRRKTTRNATSADARSPSLHPEK